MNLNSKYIKLEITINTRWFIFIITLFFMFLSCKNTLPIVTATDDIILKKLEIKNNQLKEAILYCKNEFKKRQLKFPGVIVLEFDNNSQLPTMTITTKSFLYITPFEKEMFNDNFVAGTISDGILILLNDKNNFYDKNYVAIKGKTNINMVEKEYGTEVDVCSYYCDILKEHFVITYQYCASDYSVD